MNTQRANLQLKTTEGILTQNNSSCSWDVNLEQILGDMYEKYEYFNLTLKCIVWDILPVGSINNSNPSLLNSYYMTGLNWLNCDYDVSRNQKRNRTCIGTSYYFSTKNYYTPTNMVNSFRKSKNIVNLNISAINIHINQAAYMGAGASNLLLPYTVYDFCITPCKDISETSALLTLYNGVSNNAEGGVSMLYKNVNFELLLGDLFKQYDTFSIELVDLQSSSLYNIVTDASSIVSNIELLGLSTIEKNNDDAILFGGCYFDTTRSYIVFNSSNSVIGFIGADYMNDVDNKRVVKINSKNDIVINFKNPETNKNTVFVSGYIQKVLFQLVIKPIT